MEQNESGSGPTYVGEKPFKFDGDFVHNVLVIALAINVWYRLDAAEYPRLVVWLGTIAAALAVGAMRKILWPIIGMVIVCSALMRAMSS